ncbi:adhesion G-protein coupled receptor G2-like [Solea senegalensis]|uniref:Adhesion G-protein coupled receptor G2 n=2 Tax=Solea senegalensis TaxID=28829 RepID=A0AAV6SFN3_SOLSE|nr:adhesion G-protein coupled receptor G2-like [Solea senegalensis]
MLCKKSEELKQAPRICSCGFSWRRRMKHPGIRRLYWLQILLVVLLADQASCVETSTEPSIIDTIPITAAQTSVYYFLDVTVFVTGQKKDESDIKAWLDQVLQNKLGDCVSPRKSTTSKQISSANETTAATTAAAITTAATTITDGATAITEATTPTAAPTTTATTTTPLSSTSAETTTAATTTVTASTAATTTTAATATTATTTTPAPKITAATTRAATLTTVPTTTTATTTAATTTKAPTTPATITTSTQAATSQSSSSSDAGSTERSLVIRKDTPLKSPIMAQLHKEREVRQVSGSLTETSRLSETAGIFQGSEVSCDVKTGIRTTQCSVTLQLRQSLAPCCILRTLCAASKTSSDIHVVGKEASPVDGLKAECSSKPEGKSCVYNGPVRKSCDESGTAYEEVVSCRPEPKNNTCTCSTYCNGTDAYYTLQLSLRNPEVQLSDVLPKSSTPKETSICTDDSCSSATIATLLKEHKMDCESTTAHSRSCSVILRFDRQLPICNVSSFMKDMIGSSELITFNGLVTRAALCGNISDSSLSSEFTWHNSEIKPATVCSDQPVILTCEKEKAVVVELQEQCVPDTLTTVSPNVTTMEPNTTSSINVTSSPLNTTVTTTMNTTANVSITTAALSAEDRAYALLEMTRNMSKLNSSQVDYVVSELQDILSGQVTISLILGNISVHIVSNLIGGTPEQLANSAASVIGIVDTVGLKLVLDQTETLLSRALALSVKPADGTNFQETSFSISDPSNVQVRGDSSAPQGSITLPSSLTQHLTSEQQQLASRVLFHFYQRSTVFQDKSMGTHKLNSGILGASVANLSISGLKDNVTINLKNTEPIPDDFVPVCVFWDSASNSGSGGWNPEGCSVLNSTDNITTCSCNHLTSFAILLDLSRETLTDRLHATILTFITYIGCGVSAIFLSITLLTYLAFEKLRKDIPSKILIQLCLALLMLNLVFLCDAWLALYPEAVGLCISTAWFLHYFLLVSFTWMGLEAVHMYVALVKVFNSYISHYMLRFSLVGWGVPMLVVIIVIAIDKDNYGLVSYGRFPDGTSDDFCWLKNDIAFYVAVVAYFCVIFLFNFAMLIVVLVQLCRIKRQNPHNAQHRTTFQDVRSVLGITILLGLTWGFAFFAWGPVNLAFMYLFAIFNSLQGFFIFVFHCLVKDNVRKQWRVYLCCGRLRLAENSEWSRTATQKTMKKSSVTGFSSLPSSRSLQSHSSSSSSSFLANDTTERINGIGSPFVDRIITADEEPTLDVVANEVNMQNRNQHTS